MNKERLLRFLWDLGHFRNPAMPTDVIEDELLSLSLTSPQVKTAIRSYQDFMHLDFDRLSYEAHGRPGIADGEIGPATMQLFQVERCGCPDFPDGTEPATGSGSWPAGCFQEYKNNHAFAIQVSKAGMPSFLKPHWDRVWELVTSAYRDMGMVLIESKSLVSPGTKLTFEPLQGSTIGLAIVPSRFSCRMSPIWLKLDPSYRPSDVVNQWARLLAHEMCHNMGLSHTRGGIMNPSIVSGPFTPTAWRGDPSEPAFNRFFGGVPVPPRDNPNPDPDPDPPNPPVNDLVFRGSFEAFDGDRSLGEFILTPKPEA